MTTEESLQKIVDTLSQSSETTTSAEKNLQEIVEVLLRPDETPWWDVAASIAGIAGTIIAVVAIFMTVYTVRAQNKQSLFEKRFDVYIKFKRYYEAYGKCHNHFEKIQASTAPLTGLIELYILCDFSDLDLHITKFPKQDDYEMQSVCSMAIQDLDDLMEKCSLLFGKKVTKSICIFLQQYQEVIMCLYKYQIARKSLRKDFKDSKEYIELSKSLDSINNIIKDSNVKIFLEKMKKEVKP